MIFGFKTEVYHQEPKKLAELKLKVRNFCGDFNARNTDFRKVVFTDLVIQVATELMHQWVSTICELFIYNRRIQSVTFHKMSSCHDE